ncbi:MAG: hypothetical protein J6D25_02585 [Eggerthellaceae bacterium]|nr:hypothetical protein [Eggerthellaceae bacterium]
MVFVAALVGIALGVAGFAPLIFGMNKARMASPTSNFGHAASLLLGVLLSFVLLAVGVVLCVLLARDFVVPFAVGAAGGLIVSAVVFGISKNLRK